MDTLVKNGKVRRGQLGIVVRKITSEVATSLKLKDTRGVLVADVQPGSAADRAGLKKGDIIIGLNGTEINDANVFRNQIAGTAPGTEVTLTVLRDGREQQLRATLSELAPKVEAERMTP